jgi:hypothetical protein
MKRYANKHIGTPESGSTFVERWYSQARRVACARPLGHASLRETITGLETRFDVEIASGFSEALRGKVATHYEFDVDEVGHILAPDGEQLEVMMLRARRDAYELASKDSRMQFVVDRFEEEVRELSEQQRMVRGESQHNTIITFSPYTQELIDQPDLLKAGYQRPELLRSMVRISHWDGQTMHIYTRSLDNSTLELLGLTAKDSLGHTFASNDSLGMLGERVHRSLSKGEVETMLSVVCASFDKHLCARSGKHSEQGAYAPDNMDLLTFVQAHPKILFNIKSEARHLAKKAKTYEEFETLFNGCLYKHLALYEKLLDGESLSAESISAQASNAGESASEAGATYSLCGTVVAGTAGLNTPGPLTGFESLMSLSNRLVACPGKPGQKCGKQVLIKDEHLEQGVLACTACGHVRSICGDSRAENRIRREVEKEQKAHRRELIRKAKTNMWLSKKLFSSSSKVETVNTN